MNKGQKARIAGLAVVGVILIAYGIYVYLYVPPQLSPGGVDASADVENSAAWLAGVIVVIGFGAGMLFVAFWIYRKGIVLKKRAR